MCSEPALSDLFFRAVWCHMVQTHPQDWAVGGDFPSAPLIRSPPLLPCRHLQVQSVWKELANQLWISELRISIPTPSKDQALAVDELKYVQGEIMVQILRVAPILQFILHPVGEGWLWMDNFRSTGLSFVCWQIPWVDPLKWLLQWNRNYLSNIFRDFSYLKEFIGADGEMKSNPFLPTEQCTRSDSDLLSGRPTFNRD